MTHAELAEKYGSHVEAARAFLVGEMTDEDERQTILYKFNPLTVVLAMNEIVNEKIDKIMEKLCIDTQ
jgi:hypothetical protein